MYKGTYTLIGQELSMFTRKLEAQLRYQGIPYVWQYKTMASASEIEARAGTRFIPLLDTPDGWLLNDTISIGPMLHDRFLLILILILIREDNWSRKGARHR